MSAAVRSWSSWINREETNYKRE